MLFITKIRENLKSMELNAAVCKAVDDCVREGILADFLREQRAEVIKMSIYEYDQEKHMQLIARESWEDGFADGFAEAIEKKRAAGISEELLQGSERVNKLIQRLIKDGRGKEVEQAV